MEIRESPWQLADISAVHAALDDRERSLAFLERAFAAGYDDFAAIESDRDFDLIRSDPAFKDLLEKYR